MMFLLSEFFNASFEGVQEFLDHFRLFPAAAFFKVYGGEFEDYFWTGFLGEKMMTESEHEKESWEKEFAASMRRPLAVRLRYSFIQTYKPVLDDVTFRSFERMADYRHWCETNLPSWLGYGRI